MDVLKILLGALAALLVGALGLSWKDLQAGSKDPKELAEQQQEVQKLKLEQERLQQEVARLKQSGDSSSLATNTPPPAAAPAASTADEVTPDSEEGKAALAALENKVLPETPAPPAAPPEEPANQGPPLKPLDTEAERIAKILKATPVAKIEEWVESPEAGTFAIIRILSPENVKTGTELLIRRNDGILGKLVVDSIEPEGASANPASKFPGAKPAAGDELIPGDTL